ncbi:MAG: TRAP transporter permease [Firmicutes bacterium]|nr:TRAP transporter permease [Bacillota bacterium]
MGESLRKTINWAIAIAAGGMSAFILYQAIAPPLPAMMQRAFVLMLSLFVIFLLHPLLKKQDKRPGIHDILLALLSLGIGIYVLVNYEAMVNRMGMPNSLDLILGGLLVLLVLEGTRRAVGLPLVLITTCFLAYAYFGSYISGTFGHRGYGLTRILNLMYMTTEGIYGIPVGVMVSIVLLFIIFGAFLYKSGGGDFFIRFAIAIAGRSRGGPAKIAVIASMLMGTISGSSIANVVTSGNLTIPLMKRIGYKKNFAGGVEAAASTGGQIMPPIMGAGAFIMAEFTQIPYLHIIAAAAIPATLYFFSIFMNVHFEACRNGLEGLPEEEVPKVKDVLKEGWGYFVPIIALLVILVLGYSPVRAALISIALLIVVNNLTMGKNRMKPADYLAALKDGGMTAYGIIAATACAGMIVGVVGMTGIGIKFSEVIGSLAEGKMLLGLLLTALTSIILGMSLPTNANYIVQASIAAPALVALGVPLLPAHLFCFYFGVFADITPPVALAAFAGAGISGGTPIGTSLMATRNVGVSYIVPFLFVYFPALLLVGPVLGITIVAITSLLAIVAFSGAASGFLRRSCAGWERLILLVAGALMLFPENSTDMIGVVIFVAFFIWQTRTMQKAASA